MAPGSIYLDTCFLLGVQDSEEPDTREHSLRVMYQVEKHVQEYGFIIKTPIIALGEAFLKCCEKRFSVQELHDLIKYHAIETPAPSRNVYQTASELFEIEPNLRPCDVQILSHAINDGTARWLLTTDKLLIGSKKIHSFKIEKGRNSLTVSDSLY
jgi:hypothetical protein